MITYTYDGLYRLTDALYSSGQRFQYTYDAVGVKFGKDGNVVQSYTYALSEIGGGVVLRRSDNKHH